MNKILVYHHLGLGDHIICHGIIRELYKRCSCLHLFCKQHNVDTVKKMYADLANLHIITADDNIANEYINRSGCIYDEVIKIGFSLNQSESFEKQFYRMVGVDFNKKWDSFKIPYNYGFVGISINRLFNYLSLPEKYIFVHDDDRFKINYDLIKSKKYMVRAQDIPRGRSSVFTQRDVVANSLTDYIKILTNAQELHVIDSAFLFLIDCLDYDYSHQKLYIHRYARQNPDWCLPTLRKPWVIL